MIGADGSGQAKLIDLPGDQRDPAWAHNGEAVVFRSEHEGNPELYMAAPDGSAPLPPDRNPAADGGASWSPPLPAALGVLDNPALAFSSGQPGSQDIFLMNGDGSVKAQLTDNPTHDREPSWSPDGSRLAFASNRDGGWELYAIGADGAGLTRPHRQQRHRWIAPLVAGRRAHRLLVFQRREGRHLRYGRGRLQRR